MPTVPREPEPYRRLRSLLILLALVGLTACEEAPESVEVDHLDDLLAGWVAEGRLDLGLDDDDRWIGEGWHREEERARWTAVEEATLNLPLRRAGPGVLRMRAMGPRSEGDPTQLTVVINGFVLPNRALEYPLAELSVDIPRGVLRPGHNEVRLICDRMGGSARRPLGVYVDWIEIRSEAAGVPPSAPGDRLDLHHWIEDRSGLLAAGPVEIDLRATVDTLANPQLQLCALDDQGRIETVLDQVSLRPRDGTVVLDPGPDLDPATACRLQLTAETDSAWVQLLGARRREPARADILLIMIDTLRADHLSSYGHPSARTPHLDRLGERGLRFTNALGHSPITGPSHAAYFLSRLPSRAGVVNNFEGELDRGTPTLAELLRARNYDGRAVVSISSIPSRQGFDRGFATYEEDLGPAFLRRGDRTVDLAESLLVRGSAEDPRPRFTFVHLAEPHEPYDAHGTVEVEAEIRLDGEWLRTVPVADFSPGSFELPVEPGTRKLEIRAAFPVALRRFEVAWPDSTGSKLQIPQGKGGRTLWDMTLRSRSPGTVRIHYFLSEFGLGPKVIRDRYRLEVEAVDRLVERILAALERSGRADRTWVLFVADHGEGLNERGHIGHVKYLYDEYVRVPLLLRPPGDSAIARGQIRREVAGGIDLLPTLLAAVDIPVPATATGRDLLRPALDDRRVLLETHAPQATHTKYALRGRSTKLIWTPEGDRWELYDLASDPEETHDLFDAGDERSRRWRAELEARVQAILADSHRRQAVLDPETEAALRSLGYIE